MADACAYAVHGYPFVRAVTLRSVKKSHSKRDRNGMYAYSENTTQIRLPRANTLGNLSLHLHLHCSYCQCNSWFFSVCTFVFLVPGPPNYICALCSTVACCLIVYSRLSLPHKPHFQHSVGWRLVASYYLDYFLSSNYVMLITTWGHTHYSGHEIVTDSEI